MDLYDKISLSSNSVVFRQEETHDAGECLLAPIVLFGCEQFPSNHVVETYLNNFAMINASSIRWLFANSHNNLLHSLLHTFVELYHKGKPFRIAWLAPIAVYTDEVALAKHCHHLILQNETILLVVDALLEIYTSYKSAISHPFDSKLYNGVRVSECVVKLSEMHSDISHDKISKIIGRLLTHYIQVGIKTTVCLINTKVRLYGLNDRYKSINSEVARFEEPSTTILLLRIYYRLLHINSLSFYDDDPLANKEIQLLPFSEQKKYAELLGLNDSI